MIFVAIPTLIAPALWIDFSHAPASTPVATPEGMESIAAWIDRTPDWFAAAQVATLKPTRIRSDLTLSDQIANLEQDGQRITHQRDIVFQGWPGAEVTLTADNKAQTVCRLILTKKQLIVTSFSQLKGHLNTSFVESLRAEPKFPKGPLRTAGPTWVPFQAPKNAFGLKFPFGPSASTEPIPEGAVQRWASSYGNRVYIGGISGVVDYGPVLAKQLQTAPGGPKPWPSDARRSTYVFTTAAGLSARVDSIATPTGKVFAAMLYPSTRAGEPDIAEFFEAFTVPTGSAK